MSLMRESRAALGLTQLQFGLALGYSGSQQTIRNNIMRYESGERPTPPAIERLAVMYARHGIPAEYIPPGPTAAAKGPPLRLSPGRSKA